MTNWSDVQTPTPKANPIPAELLVWMHLTGVVLSSSDDVQLAGWGKHLMEDWRSLDLLAQRYEQ